MSMPSVRLMDFSSARPRRRLRRVVFPLSPFPMKKSFIVRCGTDLVLKERVFYKWLLLLLLYSDVEASCIVHSIWCLLAQTVSIALSGQTHQTYLPLISIYTCYSKLPPCYCMKKYQGNGIHRNVAANMVHNVTRQNGDYC